LKDWNRFLDKNISQDENYNNVFDDDNDKALVTTITVSSPINVLRDKTFLV
jgi:hypothetical protein